MVSRQLRIATRIGPPDSVDAVLSSSRDEVDEYLALADRIGFACPEVDAIRLRHILASLDLMLQDRARVKDLLDKECGGEFLPGLAGTSEAVPSWGWRPLRRRDVPAAEARRAALASRSGDILQSTHTYDRALPLSVLRTAVRLHEEFPDARFFVSDPVRACESTTLFGDVNATEDRHFDEPYLAVQLTAGGELFVVDRP